MVKGKAGMGARARRLDGMVNALFDPNLGYDPGPQEADPWRAAEIERTDHCFAVAVLGA